MIISAITGGLGNQFFQYAMGRRLALKHGTELLLNTGGYGPQGEKRPEAFKGFARPLALQRFNISARIATHGENRILKDSFTTASTRDRVVRLLRRAFPRLWWKSSHIIEHQYRFQPEALDYPDNVYLQGFWQSPKYFADIVDIIRADFRMKDNTVERAAADYVNALRARHGRVVSLHIRRGDLAHAHEVLGRADMTPGAPVTASYATRAMTCFSSDTCFLVFSDTPEDIRWCRDNLSGARLEFSDAASDMWDFAAMRECDDHIIANSTFSWWAAWLDTKGGTVIAPRVWSHPNSKAKMEIEDLLPAHWVLLD